MKVADNYEVSAKTANQKVLIATQGSKYKDAVVVGIVDYVKARSVNANVIDISDLSGRGRENWDAIVILHSWEWSRPPDEVAQFLQARRETADVIVLTTSTYGNEKIPEVDAISSASSIESVPGDIRLITDRLEKFLDVDTQH